MTTPTDPTHNVPIPPTGGPQQQPPPATSYLDPMGVWQKFLSAGGIKATPQEVQMFIQGMMKMFNVVIQQQNESYRRSNEQLKKAEQGDE